MHTPHDTAQSMTGRDLSQIATQPMMMQQPISYQPVQYGPELRGVGIKFGERIDPRTGGLLVYVKRLVQGGPAAMSQRVNPGDTLVLINGEFPPLSHPAPPPLARLRRVSSALTDVVCVDSRLR